MKFVKKCLVQLLKLFKIICSRGQAFCKNCTCFWLFSLRYKRLIWLSIVLSFIRIALTCVIRSYFALFMFFLLLFFSDDCLFIFFIIIIAIQYHRFLLRKAITNRINFIQKWKQLQKYAVYNNGHNVSNGEKKKKKTKTHALTSYLQDCVYTHIYT